LLLCYESILYIEYFTFDEIKTLYIQLILLYILELFWKGEQNFTIYIKIYQLYVNFSFLLCFCYVPIFLFLIIHCNGNINSATLYFFCAICAIDIVYTAVYDFKIEFICIFRCLIIFKDYFNCVVLVKRNTLIIIRINKLFFLGIKCNKARQQRNYYRI